MANWVRVTLAASLILCGCNKHDGASSLPIVPSESVPAPVNAVAILQKGQTLEGIAESAYGHRSMSGVMLRYNRIQDEIRVPAGQEIRTPSLARIFQESGVDGQYQNAVNVLCKDVTEFHVLLPEYLRSRENALGGKAGEFEIPKRLKDQMIRIATEIDACCAMLDQAQLPHQAPKKSIGQFKQATFWLRQLAAGNADGYGYDYDLVDQHLARGLENALIWVQSGHR